MAPFSFLAESQDSTYRGNISAIALRDSCKNRLARSSISLSPPSCPPPSFPSSDSSRYDSDDCAAKYISLNGVPLTHRARKPKTSPSVLEPASVDQERARWACRPRVISRHASGEAKREGDVTRRPDRPKGFQYWRGGLE